MITTHKLATADGHHLHYSVTGQGPTLVFLHGWSSSALEWLSFAEQLSTHHRVICWNARGHGLHRYDDEISMELPAMAEDLHHLLQQEAPDGAIVVGHSMGALTLWEYIGRFGCSRLNGITIIDQSPRLLTDASWQWGVYGNFCDQRNQHFISRLEEDFPEAVCRLIFSCLDKPQSKLPDTGYVSGLRRYLASAPAPLLTRCWESLTRADLRQHLASIDVPTLLIYGGRSQFYSNELAHWVAEQISDSTLLIYTEADHSPHIAERERFIADLSAFTAHLQPKPNPKRA